MKRILALSFLLSAAIVADAQQSLTPELLWKFSRISDPHVSPDGSSVVYCVRNVNLAANKGNTDLWLVDAVNGNAKSLAADSVNETSPRWSPDGSKIYFLSDAGGSSQLWSIRADGSGRKQETRLDFDINGFGIAPSGGMIWITADVKVRAFNGKDIYPDLPKTSGRIYDDLMFRHWDTWDNGMYSHVFVGTFTDGVLGALKDIMKDEPYDTPLKPNGGDDELCWSPDGKYLVYTCKKSTGTEYAVGTNSDIYLYDVAAGGTKNLSGGIKGYDKNPLYAPDGNRLVWLSQEDPGNEADRSRLMMLDFTTGIRTELSAGFDQNVENTAWSPSGKSLYFISSVAGTQQVYAVDFQKRGLSKIRQLTRDTADHTELSVSAKGKEDVIVTSCMSISMPSELFRIEQETGISVPLTSVNKALLAGLRLGKVERRMIRSTDGKEILTWVILPPDFDANKKYPALLFCQGGPQSMVGQFWSYRWNFQLMAANGYVVVAPNRRGLPGFGSEWNDAISGDWGGQAMKDLLSAIDSVSNEPFVDKNRLGAVGASFGGYSVYWLAGNHRKRFKAFISHNGVYNMKSMLMTEEQFFYKHENEAYAWEQPASKAYTEFSPDTYIGNWDTPILVIANEKDYRVPYNQGLEAFTAARLRGIPARLLSYPDENHWVLKPQNSVLWQRVFFGWLDKYLK
ncbi:MAG: hypothetical protein RL213_109 [Bacteroidota bacterium]|jgi:dipeptidyl aminopeptidase/acylaminoacyl peptidase